VVLFPFVDQDPVGQSQHSLPEPLGGISVASPDQVRQAAASIAYGEVLPRLLRIVKEGNEASFLKAAAEIRQLVPTKTEMSLDVQTAVRAMYQAVREHVDEKTYWAIASRFVVIMGGEPSKDLERQLTKSLTRSPTDTAP
jgi:hypothetical protein